MDYTPFNETRHAFAKRLAGYGYRADTIRAAMVNEYGDAIPLDTIEDLCRAAEIDRTTFMQGECNSKPVSGDEVRRNHLSYQEQMEQGSSALWCQLWEAGYVNDNGKKPTAKARDWHLRWQERTRHNERIARQQLVERLEREMKGVAA